MQHTPAQQPAAPGPGDGTSRAEPPRTDSLRTAGTAGRSRYGLVAAAAVVGLGASLGCAVWSPWASLVATAAMVLVIAWGWPAASGTAALRGAKQVPGHSAILAASGLAGCAVVFLNDSEAVLTLLPAVVAVGVLACFIAELVRGEGAPARLASVVSACSGVLVAVSASGWVGMALVHQRAHAGAVVWATGAVIAVLIGLVGARLISAGPEDGPRRGAITLGLTPVAFFGIVGCASTFFLTRVLL